MPCQSCPPGHAALRVCAHKGRVSRAGISCVAVQFEHAQAHQRSRASARTGHYPLRWLPLLFELRDPALCEEALGPGRRESLGVEAS